MTGIAVATADWEGYYPIAHNGGNLDKTKVIKWFKTVAELDCDKVFHNASYDLGWLRSLGITVNGKIHDTMISSALLDENRYSYTLNSLAKDKLGRTKNEDLLIAAAKEFGVDPKKRDVQAAIDACWRVCRIRCTANVRSVSAQQRADRQTRTTRHLRLGDQVATLFDRHAYEGRACGS